MLDRKTVLRTLFAAEKGNLDEVKRVVAQYPEMLQRTCETDYTPGYTLMHYAARGESIEMLDYLKYEGIDVNIGRPKDPADSKVTPIMDAAESGSIEVLKWFLENGADPDSGIGQVATALFSALDKNDIAKIELLLKYGSNVNAAFCVDNQVHTPLTYAEWYSDKSTVRYLKKHGAKYPSQLDSTNEIKNQSCIDDPICAHINAKLGKVSELSLQEIVAGELDLRVYKVKPNKKRGLVTLVTSGMSKLPMEVPDGCEDYKHAEVMIHLPSNWSLDEKSLQDPKNFWPVEWLRKMAYYPHSQKTWIASEQTISNGEPAKSFASNTKLSCFLVLHEPSDFGVFEDENGNNIHFYELIPIYKEERELQSKNGTEALLSKFQQYGISPVADIKRKNVAKKRWFW